MSIADDLILRFHSAVDDACSDNLDPQLFDRRVENVCMLSRRINLLISQMYSINPATNRAASEAFLDAAGRIELKLAGRDSAAINLPSILHVIENLRARAEDLSEPAMAGNDMAPASGVFSAKK